MTSAERSKLARDRLSTELRGLRIEAGTSGDVVAAATGMSQSKFSKIENGMLLPSMQDVLNLLEALSAPENVRTDLVALIRRLHTEARSKRVVLHRGAHRHQETVTRIENRATISRFFQHASVPHLLQTEDYLRAPLAALAHDQQDAVHALRARRTRLDAKDKRFEFLLTEAGLRWRVGSARVMSNQIDFVRQTMRRPNVDVGVIPFDAVATEIDLNSFQVYDDRTVTVSVLTGNATITDPRDVGQYTALFTRLGSLALRGKDLDGVLERIAQEYRACG